MQSILFVDDKAAVRDAPPLESSEDRLRAHRERLERQARERTEPWDRSRPAIILRLAQAGEYRDHQAGNHVVRVGGYCRSIAERLGMSREFVETLSLTSTLHDIGKIGISDTVLLKDGPLDTTEWAIMKRHCEIGHEILQQGSIGPAAFLRWCGDTIEARPESCEKSFLEQAATIALTHHERWDGRGYPAGLRTDAIPLASRIVAVADVYDALSHSRPYERAYPEEKVITVMTEESVGHFDPAVFAAFRAITHELGAIRDALTDRPRVAA